MSGVEDFIQVLHELQKRELLPSVVNLKVGDVEVTLQQSSGPAKELSPEDKQKLFEEVQFAAAR